MQRSFKAGPQHSRAPSFNSLGELALAGASGAPVTQKVPRGCELDLKGRGSGRFLSGEGREHALCLGQRPCGMKQSLICVIQACRTPQPAL